MVEASLETFDERNRQEFYLVYACIACVNHKSILYVMRHSLPSCLSVHPLDCPYQIRLEAHGSSTSMKAVCAPALACPRVPLLARVIRRFHRSLAACV